MTESKKWPTHGPDFNPWNNDLLEFVTILEANRGRYWWVHDTPLKYLQVTIDTRDNGFVLRDRDSKEQVPVTRVLAAVDKNIEAYGESPDSQFRRPAKGGLRTLTFNYTNHRGEFSTRTVMPVRHYYGTSEYHEGEQWFFRAYDMEKNALRDFAIREISFNTSEMVPVLPTDADTLNLIRRLVEEEGSSVTLLSENPEGSGPDNTGIEISAGFTNWENITYTADTWHNALVEAVSDAEREVRPLKKRVLDFQDRIADWMVECFSEIIAQDADERNYRFLEEALELVQSLDCTKADAHRLVNYVFNRKVGKPEQEVGGVMVTLAALCNAHNIRLRYQAEQEYERINQPEVMQRIREKHAGKPIVGPLPGPTVEVEYGPVKKIPARVGHQMRYDGSEDSANAIVLWVNGTVLWENAVYQRRADGAANLEILTKFGGLDAVEIGDTIVCIDADHFVIVRNNGDV